MSEDAVPSGAKAPAESSGDRRPSVFPFGTPAGAGPLIGWAQGSRPADDRSSDRGDASPAGILARTDGNRLDGEDTGFLVGATGGRIWLWTEGNLVVGREGSGAEGAIPDPEGTVAIAFALDAENRLALAYYKRIKHPTTSDPARMASLLVRLVHVSPAPGDAGEIPETKAETAASDVPTPVESEVTPTVPHSHDQSPPPAVAETVIEHRAPATGGIVTSPAANVPSAPDSPRSPSAWLRTAGALGGLGQKLAPAIAGGPTPPTGPHRSIRRHLRFAVVAIVLLVGGLGGWAASTELSGAVIAMGQLVVDSNVKQVQHPFGGVVAELNVRDGMRINQGDVLVSLDGTETRANLAIVSKALDELYARQARGTALRDSAASIDFPDELMTRIDDPGVAAVVEGETRLFNTLVAAGNGQKAQLAEQVAQLEEQVRGMQKQLDAKAKEIDWNAQELVGIRKLWEKELVDFGRVTTAERDAARLEGEHGMLLSSIAEAKGKIAEIEIRILQVDEEMRTEVGKELAEVRSKIAELVEKKVAAEDQLQRLDIRAPQSGVVHELAIHTVGGVIRPGDTIMAIVPDSDALTAEVKVQPHDIDQLHVGQPAVLRFLTFNQQTTPELNAEVSVVSADVTTDQKSGATYYTARVKVPEHEIARLGDSKLMAGMPVEVFVQTNPRTVISYLVRPLADQVERAFRER
jgi:HlyD family secretion protein